MESKIHRSARNLQAIPQGKQYAGSLIRTISEIPTMFQIHIVGIGHIVMTSVRML
jgi:ACT domain-containing protein